MPEPGKEVSTGTSATKASPEIFRVHGPRGANGAAAAETRLWRVTGEEEEENQEKTADEAEATVEDHGEEEEEEGEGRRGGPGQQQQRDQQ